MNSLASRQTSSGMYIYGESYREDRFDSFFINY